MKAFVIRHAERLKFPSELGVRGQEVNEDEASITPEGRAAATERGASLKGSITRIVTSPVRRCRETADSLAQGAGLAFSSIQVDAFLSSDFFAMLRHLGEQAKQETVRKLLAGEAVTGFEPPQQQAAEALSRMAGLVNSTARVPCWSITLLFGRESDDRTRNCRFGTGLRHLPGTLPSLLPPEAHGCPL